jgi:hypothetical protein
MELRLADRTLEPKQKPVIQRIGVINSLGIPKQRIAKRTDLEQLVPIATGAGEPGHFHAEHHADAPQANLGHKMLEAKTALG